MGNIYFLGVGWFNIGGGDYFGPKNIFNSDAWTLKA